MDLLIFKNYCWSEIPREENPTFKFKDPNEPIKGREKESLVIYKTYDRNFLGQHTFTVALVPEIGEVEKLGMFYKLQTAELFADIYKNWKD